jgi:diaminopimelate epimerase
MWNGLAKSPLRVHCPGGVMTVEWKEGGDVFLTGDASVVAEGEFFFAGTEGVGVG